MKFNWKKKTSIFIGRFQPFHEGHFNLFLNAFKKNGQVAILIMDSKGINKKNPFSFSKVKSIIQKRLKFFIGKYLILKIPVTQEIIYGRKVGYKIRKINLPDVMQKISATNIRKKLIYKKNEKNF